jgi:hypothetical protein
MRRLSGLVIFVTMLLAAGAVEAQQPSLAEVAQREAERRKSVRTPTKVYTNEDVKKGLPLTTAAAQPAPAAGSEKGAGADKAPASAPGKETEKAGGAPARDEAWWRSRMAELHDQLNRSRLFAEALQSRINALWADFTARDDPAQRSVIEAGRQEALGELERVRADIARQEQAIADFEEDARKSGVPPGWLR